MKKRIVVTRNANRVWPSHSIEPLDWQRRIAQLPEHLRPAVASIVDYDHCVPVIGQPKTEKQLQIGRALEQWVFDWRMWNDPPLDEVKEALRQVGYEPEQIEDRLRCYEKGNTSELFKQPKPGRKLHGASDARLRKRRLKRKTLKPVTE